MIKQYGTLKITKDDITIEGFYLDHEGDPTEAGRKKLLHEIFQWGIERLINQGLLVERGVKTERDLVRLLNAVVNSPTVEAGLKNVHQVITELGYTISTWVAELKQDLEDGARSS